MSALEAATNATLGLIVSWVLTLYALPFWGYHPGPAQAAGITGLYFITSFFRAYALRIAFRRFGNAG